MNEQEQVSQLSALFDGELPPEQAGMVIRRALKDSSLRTTWGRYALIGACVRGEPIGSALPQADLAARVRARIAAETEHTTTAASAAAGANAARRRSLFGRAALGGAIAAGVAAISLVMVRTMGPAALPATTQVAQQVPAPAPAVRSNTLVANNDARATRPVMARDTSLPSYTTPVDDSPSRRNAPLVRYVVAHNDVAASVVRVAPLSSVMNGSYDLTQDAVEITSGAGARR